MEKTEMEKHRWHLINCWYHLPACEKLLKEWWEPFAVTFRSIESETEIEDRALVWFRKQDNS